MVFLFGFFIIMVIIIIKIISKNTYNYLQIIGIGQNCLKLYNYVQMNN